MNAIIGQQQLKNKISNKKVAMKNISIFIMKIILSFIASYLFSKEIAKNDNSLNVIVNVFSILSGFLFLVITQSSTLATFKESSLNAIEKHHQLKRFNQRFTKNTFLFICYLLVLLMIFIFFTIKNDPEYKIISKIFLHSIVFLACFSFLTSLQLPWRMKELVNEQSELNKK